MSVQTAIDNLVALVNDNAKLQHRAASAEADLAIAIEALKYYADFKTWPGHNPSVDKRNLAEWSKWYEAGGYRGYQTAKAALKELGVK